MSTRRFALLALLSLAPACRSIARAPGPEAPELAAGASGTLIVWPPGDGTVHRRVVLVDLPSRREVVVRLEEDPVAIGGLDERGRLVYAFDAERGLGLDAYARYPFGIEKSPVEPRDRWRLCAVDVATGAEQELFGLDGFPKLLELAPRGDVLVAAHASTDSPADAPWIVQVIDLSTGERRVVSHGTGAVGRCDWIPDGRAFALTGSAGGELVDARTLGTVARAPEGYGPFAPDGRTHVSSRGGRHALVSSEDGTVIVSEGRLPWPAQDGSHARETAPAEVLALCGPRLALYLGLPTRGQPVEADYGRASLFRVERPAIKVADLATGAFATVRHGNDGMARPAYSPVRLPSIER